MGRELIPVVDDVYLRMVNDLEAWNSFPWGEHIWRQLYDSIRNVSLKYKLEHLAGLKRNHNHVLSYSLTGFLFAFKIWITDSSCVSDRWWIKVPKIIPRALSWRRKAYVNQYEYFSKLFRKAPIELASTKDKVQCNWYAPSKDYFMWYVPRSPPVSIGGLYGEYLNKRSASRAAKKKSSKDSHPSECVREASLIDCDDGNVYCCDDNGDVSLFFMPAKHYEIQRLYNHKEARLNKRAEEDKQRKCLGHMNSSAQMKLAIECCVPRKRKYVDDLSRPFKRIDKNFLSHELQVVLSRAVVGHCKFLWCNDITIDRSFWNGLSALDDNRKGWLIDETPIELALTKDEVQCNWYAPSNDYFMCQQTDQDLSSDLSVLNGFCNLSQTGEEKGECEHYKYTYSSKQEDQIIRLVDQRQHDDISNMVEVVEQKIQFEIQSIEQLANQNIVLNPLMIEKCKFAKPWIKDPSRPFKRFDKNFLIHELQVFLSRAVVGRCKFPWCNDITVDCSFWNGLSALDDNRKGWLLDEHIDLWVTYLWLTRQTDMDWPM
nr:hypothetical protein [Tanacetum cinerariifolium]